MNKTFGPEKAFVLGVHSPKNSRFDALESIQEVKNLVATAGACLVGEQFIEIKNFNPSTFFGSGKVGEIQNHICLAKPDLIIVDHELTPVQNRNLEDIWHTRVADRTGLILDIFAQRAKSKEGKLQVELAQYQYLLPRLVGAWKHLSKQKGGIGLRGPGETQLEVDRRRVGERIAVIKKNLRKVSCSRANHRKKRQSVPIPTISLIGYTNAGKSTLFNRITGACETAENHLFATLDPKVKKLRLPTGQNVLVSDTVGFIRSLPHQLIESFKSTFEEVADSDLLLHVIDANHPNRTQQIQTVQNLLIELDLNHKPLIRVMNKMDCFEMDLFEHQFINGENNTVKVSGLTGLGIDHLLQKIEASLSENYYQRMNLLIPHQQAKEINALYTYGSVLSLTSTLQGSMIQVDLPPRWQNVYRQYEMAVA